nr:PREDICTED: cysteine and histidine-rich domain-containing protein 1-like [Paralichthys olivaceus]
MTHLCYNRGCGQKYDADQNKEDSCLFHPGVPIFHDALKGWSCCRKRTTDFSEFLSIKVRAQGPTGSSCSWRCIVLHSEEPKTKLPQKVSASLVQVLEKLEISNRAEKEQKENQTVMQGTRCKNPGCKTAFNGPETDKEVCTHHPGAPVFHEGYKYWSCCCIRTIDFNAFLDQKGCTAGKHRWIPKQDKKKVACRHDWHQTGNNVVVTIYAKNANPEFSCVEANGTVLSCQIQFENDKIFKRDFHLWGVIDVKQSSVNMVPTKVEVFLRKADQVSWGKLEDPNHKPEPEPVENMAETDESHRPDWDISDDDISDSDEEWAYDTPENKKNKDKDEQKKKEEEVQRKEVEEEMKRASEERRKEEEEAERKRQEATEGYDDMPDLE